MKKKLWSLLFSRYAICAFTILAEILLMGLVIAAASIVSYLFFGLTLLIDVAVVVSIINRDANPEYKVTWITVVLLMPLFGTLLYLIFYRRNMTKKEIRLLDTIFTKIKARRGGAESFNMMRRRSPLAAGKARAIMNDDVLAEVYSASSSVFFPTGEAFFKSMISELREAKSFIFLEYFIIAFGELWDEIHDILVEKVKEGVEVRLLFDDFGCMRTLPPYYEITLRREGIKAYRFNRVSPQMSSIHNNRDHRKICIIDGKVGYTGGVNIADEYINKLERFGYWKDGGIKLSGDAVGGLMKHFLSSWDFTCGTISDYDRYFSAVEPCKFSDGGYYLPFGSGPAPIYERPVGKNAFLNLINQARNYVYITTPYLIIDYELTQALCNAALRGVDVRIITPGIPDKKKVKIMTKSSYPYLMKAGVKIYEYIPGFIHEKTFVCDDKYAVIGTINFDYRSLAHHFENAVWMYASPTVLVAKDEFLKTVTESERVDDKRSRLTLGEWITKNAIRLFAPLL
ncbi:MAG: cardiolipin synthase [Clostridia bacterium]|nr:cardiolipin synthase [Clostridia bacterium]